MKKSVVTIYKSRYGLLWLLDPARRPHLDEPPTSVLGRALTGGEVLNAAHSALHDDEPTRFLSAAGVRRANAALSAVSPSDLVRAFESDPIPNHYRDDHRGWTPEALPDGVTSPTLAMYLLRFERVRHVYAAAAAAGDAILITTDC